MATMSEIPEGYVALTEDGGVLKKIVRAAASESAASPPNSSTVRVHYDGYFVESGAKFDSSRDRGSVFSFKLGQGMVIRAWDIAIASMRLGEAASILCQPSYAYGAAGSPPIIPGNAVLRFEVELLEFEKDPETVDEKLSAATALKDKGNARFKAGEYLEAYHIYQQAVDLFRWSHGVTTAESDRVDALRLLCHLNQAACQLKLSHWADARLCAEKALDVSPRCVKALFRRAQAFCGMAEFDRARADLQEAQTIEPSNADLTRELERVQREQTLYAHKQKEMYARMGQMFK